MHDRIKISIHAPRAGCDSTRRGFPAFAQISIHVPRAGCDYASGDRSLTVKQTFQSTYPVRGATTIFTLPLVRSRRFQSTYPVRGATGFPAHAKTTSGISIHVPRAGCDARNRQFIRCGFYFNPRTPCGVRLCAPCFPVSPARQFQSTYPVRGATANLTILTR